jgi:ribosomal protein S6E (S10)
MNELIDKKIGNEVDGAIISDLFNGYVFKITGGFDEDGFAMKNGILTQGRKKILLTKGCKNFRFKNGYHRTGVRKRKLVRGCIVSHSIKVLHLKITKTGASTIPGNFNLITYNSYSYSILNFLFILQIKANFIDKIIRFLLVFEIQN